MLNEDPLRIERGRVTQIFRYLEALNQYRNPAIRLIHEQPWVLWLRELPVHPAVQVALPGGSSPSGEEPGSAADGPAPAEYLLKVRRPRLSEPPPPSSLLTGWMIGGWSEPDRAVRVLESRTEGAGEDGRTVRFDESPERVQAFSRWQEDWTRWAATEQPARETMRLFEQLYSLHGRLERESERIEIVAGDGLLSWQRGEEGVFHPILLQRLQLEFDASIPEFTLSESSRPVELYSALFQSLEDVDGKAIAQCLKELEEMGIQPFGGAETSDFLRRFAVQLSAQARFTEGAPERNAPFPQLGRDPVLFVRARNLGYAKALEGILNDVRTRPELPTALLRIIGVDAAPASPVLEADPEGAFGESDDVLLSKPANPEQIQIASRLDRHGCVLVQGPPGTGKTHTIANLIGHLLAQGKSVLVTSHTTKALRVLREQVVPELRPLCVSVLGNDLEGRQQLEGAVSAIAEELSSADATSLERKAGRLDALRRRLLAEVRALRRQLLEARADEYREVRVGALALTPVEAARRVASEREQQGWIPEPVVAGAALPLSASEGYELYASNTAVSTEEEQELANLLPAPEELLLPDALAALVHEEEDLRGQEREYRPELWSERRGEGDGSALEDLARRCRKAIEPLKSTETWRLGLAAEGTAGEHHRAPWESLLALIEEACEHGARSRELFFEHAPALPEGLPLDEQLKTLDELRQHLERGGSLGAFALLTRSAWKKLIRASRVASGEPARPEHFRALEARARLQQLRERLAGRWDRQMAVLGAPAWAQLGAEPEQACRQFSAEIRRGLDWWAQVWTPLDGELSALGLRWQALLEEQPPQLGPNGALLRLRDTVEGPLHRVLLARARALRSEQVAARLDAACARLERWGGGSALSRLVRGLYEAARARAPGPYGGAFARLVEVTGRRRTLERRNGLLKKLEEVAPAWAEAVRQRKDVHGRSEPPGPLEPAWSWRQLHDELERRARTKLEELQEQLEARTSELRRITAELIVKRAWAAQVRRTSLRQQQALMGWLGLVRRIGKGTGKRAPLLRAQAVRAMNECREAVPVWIMPLAQAVENFDAATRFDVAIIDEASQSDVMALIALYLARQVVIVGDHEQVSPSAVGENIGIVGRLIDQHLQDIPNGRLYDGQLSVYALARQSFGGLVCLTEHFRCVPEIIEFSNRLSYDGRIKPLRDPARASLKPPLIAHRVAGTRGDEKQNPEEALAIVSLVAAASELPEYQGKTFGIISLLGDEQALEIEQLLRLYVSPAELERRRVLCGNAAQFQGDERDVMFLSMVDSSQEGGPLMMRAQERDKQRYNVAVSRARDQLWVVHSLDPAIDLKPGDLRRELLEHCQNPFARGRKLAEQQEKTESPFEREVLARLHGAGFRVVPQWRVGYYRIDLVVEGAGGKRLAVECDGERFHPIEKLAEDMARQAILERLGWRFVRIRSSVFYRDPKKALEPVFRKLKELGIEPLGQEVEQPRPAGELGAAVLRRAEELLREWREREEEQRADEEDAPEPKTREKPSRRASKAEALEEAQPPSPVTRGLVPASSAFACPACRSARQLWMGEREANLKCVAPTCHKQETMALDKQHRMALLQSALRCDCGAPVEIERAGATPYLVCSRHPACRKTYSWRDLEKRPRGTPV